MTKVINGVEVGACLGGGAYSRVYESPDKPDKVIMVGHFRDDFMKLALYHKLGYLDSCVVTSDDHHASVLTRMQDNQTAADPIYNAVKHCNDLWRDCNDKTALLWELGTDQNATEKIAVLVAFMLNDAKDCRWGLDNHNGNWLVDPDGDVLPMDVFNFHNTDESVFESITSDFGDRLSHISDHSNDRDYYDD